MGNVNVLIFLFLFVNFTNALIQLDESCKKRPEACDDDAYAISDFIICGEGKAYGEKTFPYADVKKGSGQKADMCRWWEGSYCEKVIAEGDGDFDNHCKPEKVVLNSATMVNSKDWTDTLTTGGTWNDIWGIADTETGTYAVAIPTHQMATNYKTAFGSDDCFINATLCTTAQNTAKAVFLDKWVENTHTGVRVQLKNYAKLKNYLEALLNKRIACEKWFKKDNAVCNGPMWWYYVVIVVLICILVSVAIWWCYFRNKKSQSTTDGEKTDTMDKEIGDKLNFFPSRNYSRQSHLYNRRGPRLFRDGI